LGLACAVFVNIATQMKLLEKVAFRGQAPPKAQKRLKKQIKLNKMKTQKLFFMACLFFTALANAQITKGNWMVGGTGDYSSTKTTYTFDGVQKDFNRTIFNITPNIGYFIVDKFAVGTYAKFGYDDFGDLDSTSFGFGPFARYYFLEPEKIVNIFAQASVGYNEGKSNNGGEYHINDYGIKAGTVVFFNSSVALELSLGYNSSSFNSTSIDKGLKIGLGFQIHLKK
jgi:hypothetical protein